MAKTLWRAGSPTLARTLYAPAAWASPVQGRTVLWDRASHFRGEGSVDSAGAAIRRRMSSRADVINPKTATSEKEAPLRSPGAFGGGGGGGCGTPPAPTMATKLEQKAIDELDDMSIIDDVRDFDHV